MYKIKDSYLKTSLTLTMLNFVDLNKSSILTIKYFISFKYLKKDIEIHLLLIDSYISLEDAEDEIENFKFFPILFIRRMSAKKLSLKLRIRICWFLWKSGIKKSKVNLLFLRFYRSNEGFIKIGGINITEFLE